MTTKVMFSFADELVARMKSSIPTRERSKVMALLLEKEISAREKTLYLCAKELEDSNALKNEMNIWENEFSQDGLENV